MDSTLIDPERLAALDNLTLDEGAHGSFEEGHCAMEIVSWLADQGHTDSPPCASPVLRRYTIRLNDRWDQEKRQALKPYLPRMVGTGSDGKDELREQIATEFLCDRLLGPWLQLAGMTDELDQLKSMATASKAERRDLLYAIREAAWAMRRKNIQALKAKVLERLKDRPAVAVAVAADAAVAAAAAVAVAVDKWTAAYWAARKYYNEHPLPISQDIADLGASQDGIALELLEALIDPAPVGA